MDTEQGHLNWETRMTTQWPQCKRKLTSWNNHFMSRQTTNKKFLACTNHADQLGGNIGNKFHS